MLLSSSSVFQSSSVRADGILIPVLRQALSVGSNEKKTEDMGVNLTIARLKVNNDKILGNVKSLGLYEVDWNDCGERVESIEIRDGLPLFGAIIRGQIIQDDGILYLEPIEKLFLADMICTMSGREIFQTKENRSFIPLIKAEVALKAIAKLIPLIPYFKEEGFIDKDPDRAKIKYEENKLLEIYELDLFS